MNILVMIKQVPDTDNVKMDPVTGTMIREGLESVINPLDLYALEEAIALREIHGGIVTVLTMGPDNARAALKEALSMGCDRAILASDREFAGADTWSTSYVLAECIKYCGEFDLILAGERATDGDTGQVGPGTAAWLDLPFLTYVNKIVSVAKEYLTVERLVENGYETHDILTPCLITVIKEINYPRLPTLNGKKRARQSEIQLISTKELNLNKDFIGLKGSPTRVIKIEKTQAVRNGKIIKAKTPAEIKAAVLEIADFIDEFIV